MKCFSKTLVLSLFFLAGVLNPMLWAKPTIEDQQERLLLIFILLQDEKLLAAPGVHPNGWRFGLDFSFIPQIKATVGTKQENVDFSPVIARPIFRVDAFDLFFIQAGGTSEIQVGEVTTETFSAKLGVGYDTGIGKFSFWGNSTTGRIVAPITEPSLPSEDVITFGIQGAGMTYGVNFGDYDPYFSVEYRSIKGEFFIPEDKNTIETTYDGPSYGFGLMYSLFSPLILTFEEAYVPGILLNPRLSVFFRF